MVKLSEHQLQTQIIKWARAQHGKWCNIFAIPNGGATLSTQFEAEFRASKVSAKHGCKINLIDKKKASK